MKKVPQETKGLGQKYPHPFEHIKEILWLDGDEKEI